MANFLPKKNEMITQSLMMNESAEQFGYPCRLLIPSGINLPELGFQQDIGYNEEDAVHVYMLPVNGSMTPKLLKKLGWNIETSDSKPFLVQVSRFIKVDGVVREITPTIYSKVDFDYSYDFEAKEFIATNVSSNAFNPIQYTMSLAPYRPNAVPDHEPLREENLERLNIEETEERFRFMAVPRRGEELGIKY